MTLTTQNNQVKKIEADKVFQDLFDTLTALYPSIKAQLNEKQFSELKGQWIIALGENGIRSTGLLKAGFTRARREKREFLPPVGVFIEWCKHEYAIQKYKIPTVGELLIALKHYSAMKGIAEYRSTSRAKHYLVTGLYSQVKSKQLNEEKTLNLANAMIDELIDKANSGFEIPDMTQAIESNGKPYIPISSIDALLKIKEIKSMIRGKSNEL